MRKLLAVLLALLLCCPPCLAAPEEEAGVKVSAQSAIVYDPAGKQVLYARDEGVVRGMASTTKIMTALVALELYSPEQAVKIEPGWCGVEGSSMYLVAGEELRVLDLLYGLMLMSGNDAAVALASLYTGDAADFVALMNEKAQSIGMKNTLFENPSGLDGEGHYSTAYDMALLAGYALQNETFCAIAATRSVMAAGRYMKNHNKLLSQLSGALGLKTGYTKACGRCLVSAVKQKGRTLIVVTLNAPDDWRDHANLYAWAFSRMEERQLLPAGVFGSVPVVSGTQARAQLYIKEGFSCALSAEEQARARIVLNGPRFCYAPVAEEGEYGTISITIAGNAIRSLPVYFKENVEEKTVPKGFFARLWDAITNWFK